jgi:prepilin-type N-terminal cleavage/methylation domain-containing protein
MRKNEKGFTIIEVMMALMIVAVSIIPITTILPRVLSGNKETHYDNRTTFLGEKKMEEMKTKALTYFNWNYSISTPTAFSSPDDKFKYTVSDDYGLDIKQIVVTVWYDVNNNNTRDTGEQYVIFRTKITNRGKRIV